MEGSRIKVIAPAAEDLEGASKGRLSPWLYAIALAWWASSWNLRSSVLMAWSPLDPVSVGAVAVALCVVHRLGQPTRFGGAQIGCVLLLVVGFLPGALASSGEGYGPHKLTTMLLVTLPMLLAALVLLDSRETRRCWLWAQAFLGLAVAAAALRFHDTSHSVEQGRFALETLDTITTARFVGVAVLGLLLVSLGSARNSWWAFPLAAGGGMVMVQIGSRGPLLAVFVAFLVVVASARHVSGRRALLLAVGGLVGAVAFRYALAGGGSGGRRIVESLESGLSDGVRVRLLGDAVDLGLRHLLGIGWGDFAQASATGAEIANGRGVAYAHNVFAETFAEGGLFALLAFSLVVFFALATLRTLSTNHYDAVVFGTAIYWLLNALVSSDMVGNRFMWISLACGVAARLGDRQPHGSGGLRDRHDTALSVGSRLS